MPTRPSIKPVQRLACSRAASSFAASSARRTIPKFHCPLHQARAQTKPSLPRSVIQKEFRRSYAEIATPKTKRRGRSILRWTWRFTYLGAIGGFLYMGYGIYLLRTPQDQLESGSDPNKKTLVILGIFSMSELLGLPLTVCRHRLGRCIPPQET